MKVENIKEINTTALAYMGDAVYELAVREEMMKQGYYNVNRLHQYCDTVCAGIGAGEDHQDDL